MKALILAGGRGTRMRPITHTLNKHLIPIAGEPMLFRIIRDVADLGVKEIIVNLNQGDKEVPAAVGTGKRWGVKIRYIEQEKPNGMMYPIKLAQDLIGNNNFIFSAGDNILSGGLKKHLKTFREYKSDAHVLVVKRKDYQHFGVAKIKGNRIIDTVEKPKTFVSDLVLTGIYFFTPCVFAAMDKAKPIDPKGQNKPEYYPPTVINVLLKEKKKFTYSEVTGWWKDTGLPIDINLGNQLVMSDMAKEDFTFKGSAGEGSCIDGRVKTGKGTVINGRSMIRGPVIIGENCIVENSFIGPYTAIGNNSVIKNAEIENSIVMDNVQIDTGMVRVVDSLIGNNAKITPNGCTLPTGHRLIIGEHASVEL